MTQHHHGCGCEICKHGLEVIERKERHAMETIGWYCHYVMDDDDYPFRLNFHTHGLPHTFNHLDFQIVMPLSPVICHGIVSGAIDLLKEGKRFEAGKEYDTIIQNYNVMMMAAKECGRDVLRIIFPDDKGGFDGDYAKQFLGTIKEAVT